jgi:hypothetical protein
LDTIALPITVENQTTNEGARSVYKYKPVALKTRPVVQELPAEFRIKREIIGDPLAEMPKLSLILRLCSNWQVYSRTKGPD